MLGSRNNLLSIPNFINFLIMKNWLTPVVATVFAVAGLASCKKDEVQATITPSNSVVLTSSTNSVVLVQANGAQNAVTYNWTPSSFTIGGTENKNAPSVSYQLQVVKAGDSFGSALALDAGIGRTKAVTVTDLNTAIISLGLAPGAPANILVRLAAVVGTDAHSFVSNVVPITVTPYRVCLPPNTDTWGLVGPAGDGWPGATATDRMLTWDCNQNAYILRTTLNAGPFKFRKNQDWGVNLGGVTGDYTQGIALTPNGADMVATAGTYTVKLVVTGSGAGVTGGRLTITP